MPNYYLNKFISRCRPFNTELSLWVKFRINHKNQEIIVEDNKIIYKNFGIIAKFESNIEALRTVRLAGYKLKSNVVLGENGVAKIVSVMA